MNDLAPLFHAARRRLGFAAALAGAAAFLAVSAPLPTAEARTTKSDLAVGPGGTGTAAEGRIQFKQQKRGERLKLRLDNLQPRTDYEVRDAATEDVLGTIRTDRRGRGKKTLRSGSGRTLSGALLEICEPGSDDPILEGQVPGDENGMPWFGGAYKVGTVSTDYDAAVQVSITLSSTSGLPKYTIDENGEPTMGRRDDGDDGAEGTYESISLFAGPGGVWTMQEGTDYGIPEFSSISGPVTFWIADGEEGLVRVATIEKDDWGKPIEFPGAGGYEGGGDAMGGNGTADSSAVRRKGRRHRGSRAGQALMDCPNAPNTGFPDFGGDPGNGGWTDGMNFPQPDFYSWYADNASDPGLPLGVTSVSDLSGRAFEVRDGEGAVLLEGVLPQLEEIVYDPMPWPGDDGTWGGGGDHTINININIDLSGFDWGSADFSNFDWGSFDWGAMDFGSLLGGDGSDFSKLLQGLK